MDPNKRRAVAIWRMNILGPLVSARLEHGDKRELLEEAASRTRALLVSILDCATRYVLASTFVLVEDAVHHEAFLKRVLRVHGRPRRYYVDGGAPYRADSLGSICADLGIERRLTGPNDPEAKGAIERWHRTWRDELGVELRGETLALDHLNTVHHAWLEADYHARLHGTTGRAPREPFLEEVAAGALRPLPRGIDLDVVFLHRATTSP